MKGFINDIFQVTYFLPTEKGFRQVTWKVGQKQGDSTICEIMYDENFLKTYKNSHRISIIVKDGRGTRVWGERFIPIDAILEINSDLNEK